MQVLWRKNTRGVATMRKKLKKRIKKEHIIVFIIIIILALIVFAPRSLKIPSKEKIVREPVVAGTWYPGNKEELKSTVNKYYENSERLNISSIKALIVPHAGYVYSGQVAANGFNQLNKNYKKVFIIATNHAQGAYVNGISIPNATHYKTPLGEVKVSEIAPELLKQELFVNVPQAHTTHVIEIELPFLQQKLRDFEIIPLVTGSLNLEQIKQAADALSKYIDEDSLIVISSDLSHYHPYEDAVKLDTTCIKNIESMNFEESTKCEACGIYAILILMDIAKRNEWKAKIIDYKNSGDVTGDKSRVVGYSSIVFYSEKEELLTKEEQKFLLNLARETVESYVKNKKKPKVDETKLTPAMKKVQGCFVTLNKNNDLRGCIGHILPQEELYKCIIDNAVNAAVNDHRFNPVTEDELNDIEIEISVLTVPQRLEFSSGDDLKNKLRPNIDGIVLKSGFHQSTYLPQVWEQIPNKESFLSNLCMKGGMAIDCWKDKSTEVYTYQAFVFD
ncbi:MAG: hypothetical protein DRP29_07725 [Thermodesulfobacteriota bacterium]|nr:MAG: hypothetical protein DRP29_07725 [Thermodesulfobacteriota bacterium]